MVVSLVCNYFQTTLSGLRSGRLCNFFPLTKFLFLVLEKKHITSSNGNFGDTCSYILNLQVKQGYVALFFNTILVCHHIDSFPLFVNVLNIGIYP